MCLVCPVVYLMCLMYCLSVIPLMYLMSPMSGLVTMSVLPWCVALVPVCTGAGKSAEIWGACTGVCCVDALCPLFTFLCQAGRPYVRLCPFRTVMYLAGWGSCPILAFLCLDAWRVPVCTGAGKLDLEGATGGRGARSCSLCS